MSNSGACAQVLRTVCSRLSAEGYPAQCAKRAEVFDTVKRIAETLAAFDLDEPLLKVALVGEFNAGKSSLANAILGRPLAHVDVFRCTRGTTTFVSDTQQYADLELWDGGRKRVGLEEFHQHWQQFKRAEVHVPISVPIILVDTPGLGTTDEQDTVLAEDAVLSADLLLWLMDPSDMLSALEGAFLKRAREIGMPIWCVITKSDELQPGEDRECREEVVQRTGLLPQSVFVVSAENHLRGEVDAGFNQLMQAISKEIQRAKDTKGQAQVARLRELGEELSRAVSRTQSIVDSDVRWCEAERAVFVEHAAVVKNAIRTRMEWRLRHSLFERLSPHLEELQQGNEEALNSMIKQFFEESAEGLATSLADFASQEAQSVWQAQYQDRVDDLRRQIEQMTAKAVVDEASRSFLNEQIRLTREREAAVDVSFNWVRGLAVLTTIAIAASSGLPAIGLGLLAGGVAGFTDRQVLQALHGSAGLQGGHEGARDALRAFCDRVAEQIVAGGVGKASDAYVDEVAAHALTALTDKRFAGATPDTIASFSQALREAKAELEPCVGN